MEKFSRQIFVSCAASFLVVLASCSKPETDSVRAPGGDATDSSANVSVNACTLLTSEEIAALQGEPVQETKLSGGPPDQTLAISQCFFALPTYTKSVTLQVVRKGEGAAARDPRQAWREMFAPEKIQEMEREGGAPKRPPRAVPGLGEAAFWFSGPAGGLYVLQNSTYLFLSIGGADDEETKLTKTSELARLVLPRL